MIPLTPSQTSPSYRKTVYPKAWNEIQAYAHGRGLIHGMQAHTILRDACRSLPDTADFLRDMVQAGALRPLAKDTAGAGHSVQAFRTLQQERGGETELLSVDQWLTGIPCEATNAHLWTFEV